jgi:hypothetical protein
MWTGPGAPPSLTVTSPATSLIFNGVKSRNSILTARHCTGVHPLHRWQFPRRNRNESLVARIAAWSTTPNPTATQKLRPEHCDRLLTVFNENKARIEFGLRRSSGLRLVPRLCQDQRPI